LWCGACHRNGIESRVIFTTGTGNGGTYEYFLCRSRQHKGPCREPYRQIGPVEDAVLRHYATVAFTSEFIKTVRDTMDEALADRQAADQQLVAEANRQLGRLDVQEGNLLDLIAAGDVPTTKVKERLRGIARDRERLTNELDTVRANLDVGAAVVSAALELLSDPQKLYRQAPDDGRRLMNQAIFEKLYVETDGTFSADRISDHRISDHRLKEPFAVLDTLQQGTEPTNEESHQAGAGGSCRTNEAKGSSSAHDHCGVGSSKGLVVELMGIEPTTPCLQSSTATVLCG